MKEKLFRVGQIYCFLSELALVDRQKQTKAQSYSGCFYYTNKDDSNSTD